MPRTSIRRWIKAAATLCDTWFCNVCHGGYPTYGEAQACELQHHRDKYGR